ncbi:MAG: FadD3 family acyl-CoA ligase [Rhodococcus sp. (in: high G+C Gram-positive bacteria)]
MKASQDTIPTALASAVRSYPAGAAVCDGDTVLSWTELSDRVRAAAAGLLTLGVADGDAVAVWSPNTWHWVVAALAVHHTGAALVPVNTRYTGQEAQDVIARTHARVLLVADAFLGHDLASTLDRTEMPHLASVVLVPVDGRHPRPDELPWDVLSDPGADIGAVDASAAAVTEETVSDILFTSGTTGRSKAVACTHRQSLTSSRGWAECGALTADDRYLIINPFFHSFGYKAGILASLQTGATIVPHRTFDVAAVLATIEERRITVLPGPPTIYRSILDSPDRAGRRLDSLRLAVTGAASIPVTLIEELERELSFDTVLTAYGLTESGGFATMCRPGDDATTVASTSGRAMPGYEVRIADTGEILVRGPGVMREYLGDPEATAATLDIDGWLHTGDIGSLDDAGNLRITDRLKDMFVCGGFNVYPAEVEQRILTLDGIRECAVIGVPDERLGEVGAALVVLDPHTPLAAESLPVQERTVLEHCRATLANFKIPRSVDIRTELPRNASGKVLKKNLREELS